MRVGFVVEQLLAPVPGGTGRFARQIAAALAATAAPGDTIDGWCAWRSDPSAAAIAGLGGPHRIGLGRRALAEAWSRGIGPAPSGADVVHAPTLLMPPRRRAPVVVTIHDAVPWTHPETLTARGAAWHRRMGERAAAGADLITVDTRAVADALGRHLDLGSRVRVLGAGASLAVPRDAAERRRRLGLPAGYLAFVGTLEPRKGFDVLLDALPGLDLPLAVVGPQGWGGVDLPSGAVKKGKIITISGTVTTDENHRTLHAGNLDAQMRYIYESVKNLLEKMGASMDDVIKTTDYITPQALPDYGKTGAIRAQYFKEGSYPAATGIVVHSLLRPDWLIEIESCSGRLTERYSDRKAVLRPVVPGYRPGDGPSFSLSRARQAP